MINTILVLTDFSEGSNNALEYALNLAKMNSAAIILMHLLEDKNTFQTTSKRMEETVRLVKLKEPK